MDPQLEIMLQRTEELHTSILKFAAEFRPQDEARQVLSFNAGILSLEQAFGIHHLFKSGHISPGLTLLRTQFESLVRGVWLLYAAEAEWIEKLRQPLTEETAEKGNDAPMLSKMFKQLASSQTIQPALLAQLLDYYELSKRAFNSFAHGGMHPLSRVWMGSHAEIKAAEEVASRVPCKDFEFFAPLFDEAKAGLKTGAWLSNAFGKNASIEQGDFFIVGGQIAYVAEVKDGGTTKDGRDNPRLRVIFDNQTEADLLLRSLSRSLYPDGDAPVGRRLLKVDAGPLFGDSVEPDDIETGSIYVLRSRSNHPFVAQHRELIHKIGVTGGKVETRISGAENDATYLLAAVDVVAEYKLHNINRTKLEGIFHRVFGAAQLDLTIEDRFGTPVKPREWFLAPLQAIDEAVQRIKDGSITRYSYDPKKAELVLSNGKNSS